MHYKKYIYTHVYIYNIHVWNWHVKAAYLIASCVATIGKPCDVKWPLSGHTGLSAIDAHL